jgi:hypothetical protein
LPYISFGDKDRARWGLTEEWLEFDLADISIVDLQELSERHGFDYMEWPEPFFGAIPFEQAGSPDAQRVAPRWQVQAMVWLTLRQNGTPVPWDEAGTARMLHVGWRKYKPGEEPPESPGKDSIPAKVSRPRASSTTTPSSTSGRRSRAKS